MNLNSLSPKARALVEALTEPATDEKYEIVDVDEDGDTVSLTFRRDLGSDDNGEDDEDEDS